MLKGLRVLKVLRSLKALRGLSGLRSLNGLRSLLVLWMVGFSAVWVRGETVESLPAPTNYVSDFAGVLSPETVQQMDALCQSVDRQAHAQIAVVTIKTIDPDKSGATPTIEEFAVKLEEKWGVGTKGTDRGVLMLLVMNPRRGRIEVGYGLEGILNDAKAGDIGRQMAPYAQRNDYDDAVKLGVKDIAGVIAADAGVTLNTAGAQPYRGQDAQPQPMQLSLVKVVVIGGGLVLLLVFLAATGNLGLVFWFLLSMVGGGGGRGGWRGGGGGGGGDDEGGGFGGFGGGQSGGGGASGDF